MAKEDEFKKRLGRRLAKLRTDAGLTQAELAAKIDVAFESVSRHERGATMLGLLRLRDIADVLKVEMRDFFPADSDDPEHTDALAALNDLLRERPAADVHAVRAGAEILLARLDEVAPKPKRRRSKKR